MGLTYYGLLTDHGLCWSHRVTRKPRRQCEGRELHEDLKVGDIYLMNYNLRGFADDLLRLIDEVYDARRLHF
jgi:hypothetical protein